MQGAIDSQAADAAVKDADGELGISDFGFRISDWQISVVEFVGLNPGCLNVNSDWNCGRENDFKSAFRNPKSEIQRLVEAPRIELGSKRSRRKTLHA